MKIIDRKGKVLGLINIIDLLVLILIIGFITVVVVRFNSQKLNANGGNPLTEKEEVYVTLYASLVVPEISENLHIGDKLVANNAYTSAEIVDIKVEPAAYVSTNSDGEAVLSEHPLWKDVTVVIKDTVNPSSVILKAANQEVRVGYSFILKTQTVETNTKIRGVEFGGYSLDTSEVIDEETTESQIEILEEDTTSSSENNSQTTNYSSNSNNQVTNTSTNSNNQTNTSSSSSNQVTTSTNSNNQANTTSSNSNNQTNTSSNSNNQTDNNNEVNNTSYIPSIQTETDLTNSYNTNNTTNTENSDESSQTENLETNVEDISLETQEDKVNEDLNTEE